MPIRTDTVVVGRDYLVPVSRGTIKWRTEPWGVILTETIHQHADGLFPTPEPDVRRIHLPWKVIDLMLETKNGN